MNLIVLVSDTFRYDYLGCNGNNWIGTHNLDRFAKRAVNFDRHYLSSFPTIPNRTDLFTGRYSFPFHGWKPLDPHIPVMSTVLGGAGYQSQLICDTPHMMKGTHNFDRGFDGAYWIRGQEGDKPLLKGNLPPRVEVPVDGRTRVDKHLRDTRFGNLATLHSWTNRDWAWEEDRFCVQTARTTSRWLEENRGCEPFALWVDFFDVHEPWDPPEYLVQRYDTSGYDGPPMIHPNYGPASAYSKKELANLKAHYAAEAYLVDKWIGHVLQKIEELGLFDDSVVVFTSDHGMLLGEHNRTGKSNIHPDDTRVWPLYQEISHIPLMVSAPGVKTRRVKELTQSVDLLPTLLDLAKIKAPAMDMHGHSLTPLMCGAAASNKAKWPRQYAFSSTFLRNGGPTVTDKRWTYISYGEKDGKPELYDLKNDPGQKKNLINKEPKVVRRMQRALADFLAKVGTPKENYALLGPVGGPDWAGEK
jgi:arylsulfatase A-like enzyme